MASSPNPRAQALLAAIQRWNRSHPSSQDVDPQAELAVAGQEGLGGGVGDAGTSFGPHQLHAGGALPAGVWARGPAFASQWSWAPGGLDYAVSRVAGVSGGRHGADAVNRIVRLFERPANPDREVARSLAAYGGGVAGAGEIGGGAPQPLSAGPAGAAAPDSRRAFVMQLLGAISPTGQLDNPAGLVGALQARRQPVNAAWGTPGSYGTPSSPPASPTSPPARPSKFGGGVAELLNEGVGGPTRSTGAHIHAAFNDPRLELAAIGRAQSLGLHIGENPYVGDVVDPVHTKGSYHYQTFPGLFNGRRLGRAIDVSGPKQAAFYQWLAGMRA